MANLNILFIYHESDLGLLDHPHAPHSFPGLYAMSDLILYVLKFIINISSTKSEYLNCTDLSTATESLAIYLRQYNSGFSVSEFGSFLIRLFFLWGRLRNGLVRGLRNGLVGRFRNGLVRRSRKSLVSKQIMRTKFG